MLNKQIKVNIVFELDSNYTLKVRIAIPECNQLKEINIGAFQKNALSKLKAKLVIQRFL
jgi:hypothetical protein